MRNNPFTLEHVCLIGKDAQRDRGQLDCSACVSVFPGSDFIFIVDGSAHAEKIPGYIIFLQAAQLTTAQAGYDHEAPCMDVVGFMRFSICPYNDDVCDEDMTWDCFYTRQNDECPMTGGVASLGFWTYSVNDDDGFEGISSTFETKHYDAVKVTNDATGDVIYEYGEFGNDEDDDA